jgi:hypothetical protein
LPFHFDKSPAWLSTRHTLVGLTEEHPDQEIPGALLHWLTGSPLQVPDARQPFTMEWFEIGVR